jgi:cytochrome c oxidase cbb3-type subunit 3
MLSKIASGRTSGTKVAVIVFAPKLLRVAFLVTLLPAATVAQETARATPAALQKENVVRGQAVFVRNCAACHGTGANGGVGPNLLTSVVVRHDATGEEIGKVVHEGRMDKGMPAFPKITDAQVSDIAAFLHAKILVASRGSALSGLSMNASSLMGGNAAAGQHYFQAKCAACHSATGDLAGVAKKHDPAELQTTMLMPKAGPNTGSVTADGKTFTGTFLHRDEFTVTMRTADGTTHTWRTNRVHIKADDPLKGHRDLLPTYTDKDMHDVFAYLETLR